MAYIVLTIVGVVGFVWLHIQLKDTPTCEDNDEVTKGD